MTTTITLPSISPFIFAAKTYAFQVAKEIIQTGAIAAAGAGLTLLATDIPFISAHYGLSPLFTAQAIAVVGSARAFISGLNSVKANSPVVVPAAAAANPAAATPVALSSI